MGISILIGLYISSGNKKKKIIIEGEGLVTKDGNLFITKDGNSFIPK